MSGAPSTDEVACIDCQPDPAHPSAPPAAAPTPSTQEDLMNPSTFLPPLPASALHAMPAPLVVIEYCQRCKFGLRAHWVQQELLSTFAPIPPAKQEDSNTASIASVMAIPKVDDASSGRFRVWILPSTSQAQGLQLVWDRKVEGGFPEIKVLKQKVRDHVNPDFGLGHSDKK